MEEKDRSSVQGLREQSAEVQGVVLVLVRKGDFIVGDCVDIGLDFTPGSNLSSHALFLHL